MNSREIQMQLQAASVLLLLDILLRKARGTADGMTLPAVKRIVGQNIATGSADIDSDLL